MIVDLGNHLTTENIAQTGCFTVAIADVDHVVACDYVGVVSGKNEPDKMKKAGFTTVPSEFVHAPIIQELALTLECKLEKIVDGSMYIGKIVNVSADEAILGEDGLPDLSKWKPISFEPAHLTYVTLGETVGKAFADGKQIEEQ